VGDFQTPDAQQEASVKEKKRKRREVKRGKLGETRKPVVVSKDKEPEEVVPGTTIKLSDL